MKQTRILAAIVILTGSLMAQQSKELPQAQITFRVITDEGKPVQNVEVAMATFHHWQRGEGFGKDVSEIFTGVTDGKGLVTITSQSLRGDFAFGPREKAGFYRGGGGEYQFKEAKEGKWQPWNPTVDVVMKPIINPIAMFARKMGDVTTPLELPQNAQAVGFDLMAGDWVAPHGKGSVADLVFTLKETIPYVRVEDPFDVTLTISFSNKGDGIQSILAPINKGSELRLPRFAPKDGYEQTLVKEIGRSTAKKPINSGIREDQNYFFRVRTVLDDQGRIKSALYGKINGDILFWGNRKIRFDYCLNPNPNDRNLEFDPKKNLFGTLPFNQRVTTP